LKPDLESLIKWGDNLLAIPSGSTETRVQGVLVNKAQITPVDFSEIYTHLRSLLPELNIEGAAIRNDEFILFQRGNGPSHTNALISLDLHLVQQGLSKFGRIPNDSFRRVKILALGSLNGVPLSFTDAALENDQKIWFLAAAAASDST
jgi:hypothetical protein